MKIALLKPYGRPVIVGVPDDYQSTIMLARMDRPGPWFDFYEVGPPGNKLIVAATPGSNFSLIRWETITGDNRSLEIGNGGKVWEWVSRGGGCVGKDLTDIEVKWVGPAYVEVDPLLCSIRETLDKVHEAIRAGTEGIAMNILLGLEIPDGFGWMAFRTLIENHRSLHASILHLQWIVESLEAPPVNQGVDQGADQDPIGADRRAVSSAT